MYLILFSCGICNRQYSCLGGGGEESAKQSNSKKKKKTFLSSVRCFLWAFPDFPIKVALNQSQAFFHVDNYLKMWCSGQQFIATHFLSVISPLAATGRKGGSGQGRPLGGTVAPRRAAPAPRGPAKLSTKGGLSKVCAVSVFINFPLSWNPPFQASPRVGGQSLTLDDFQHMGPVWVQPAFAALPPGRIDFICHLGGSPYDIT